MKTLRGNRINGVNCNEVRGSIWDRGGECGVDVNLFSSSIMTCTFCTVQYIKRHKSSSVEEEL